MQNRFVCHRSGKLIREQVLDKNGNVLPNTVTSGSYQLRDLTNKAIGSLFEGKVTYDKTYGHVAYGCAECCGYADAPYMYYDPLGVALGLQSGQDVWDDDLCTGQQSSILFAISPGSWTTGNGAIATASKAVLTGVAVGSTTNGASGSLTTGIGGGGGRKCPIVPINPNGQTNVVKFTVQGNPYNSIFVGADPNLATASSVFAAVSPTGGTFSETSSASGDTFTAVQSGGPGWVVDTTTQSTNLEDRKLTFTYTASGQAPVSQSLNVTARQFAYVANNSPGNTCVLGNGTTQLYTYTPYTHPDKTAVEAQIGLANTAVTESFSSQPPAGTITGSGALNADSQFTDLISYCSSSALTISRTITQTIKIEGYQVRQNTLQYSSTGVTLTSLGPTQ